MKNPHLTGCVATHGCRWSTSVALGVAALLSLATAVAQPLDTVAESPALHADGSPLSVDAALDERIGNALIQHEDLLAPLTPHCTSYSTRRSLFAAKSWGTLRKLSAPNRYLIGRSLNGRSFSAREYSIFEVRGQQVYPLHYQQHINKLEIQFNNFDWDAGVAHVRHRKKIYQRRVRAEIPLRPGTLDAISMLVQVQLELRQNQGKMDPTEYQILYKGKYRLMAVQVARPTKVAINTSAGRLRTVELVSIDVARSRVDRLWLAEELDYMLVWAIRSSPSHRNMIVKFSDRLPVDACELPSSITGMALMAAAE